MDDIGRLHDWMLVVLFLQAFHNILTTKSKSQPDLVNSQTRSVRGTQKKLKIFENSCPKQLLKLACTGLHLQCLIAFE